jgi:hypothetical protein
MTNAKGRSNSQVPSLFIGTRSFDIRAWSLELLWSLVFGFWSLCLPTPPIYPQFIRPTVPRPVNIGDFVCFIRPNVRPKPSQIRPIRPKAVFNTSNLTIVDRLTGDSL